MPQDGTRQTVVAPRTIKVLYFGSWLVIAAAVIYFTMAAGYSFWLGAVLAWVVLGLVNGSLAYWLRAKQMRAQGEKPPPFLVYLLYPKAVSFRDKVPVPRVLRVLVGLVFLVCGAVLAVVPLLVIASLANSADAQPIRTAIGMGIVSLIGWPIVYVGFRLIVVTNDEPLFRRAKPSI
jgi:hypothetical protein